MQSPDYPHIKELRFVFPHGATQRDCDQLARIAQELTGFGLSSGGYKVEGVTPKDALYSTAADKMEYTYDYDNRDSEDRDPGLQ